MKFLPMKTTLRIICSPLPPGINTLLVLALLCCIAGMVEIYVRNAG